MTKAEIKIEIKIIHICYPLIERTLVAETIRTQTLDVFYYRNGKPKTKRLQMWTDWMAKDDELEIKGAVREYLASIDTPTVTI